MIPISIKMPDGSIHSLEVNPGETIEIGCEGAITGIRKAPKWCSHRRAWAQACETCGRAKTIVE